MELALYLVMMAVLCAFTCWSLSHKPSIFYAGGALFIGCVDVALIAGLVNQFPFTTFTSGAQLFCLVPMTTVGFAVLAYCLYLSVTEPGFDKAQ